jgi:nuclear transport factor 2 (NTF2) superfamily protein
MRLSVRYMKARHASINDLATIPTETKFIWPDDHAGLTELGL